MVPEVITASSVEGVRGFLQCLSCSNDGVIWGDWLDPEQLSDPVTARPKLFANGEYRSGAKFIGCARCAGDELFIADVEGVPGWRSEGWGELLELCRVLDDIDDDDREAFLAFCANQHFYDVEALARSFGSAWCGHWDSFEDFAEHYADECGYPVIVANLTGGDYFDREAFARDLEHDYTVLGASPSGVFVFRD